jgi:hypothetical protein
MEYAQVERQHGQHENVKSGPEDGCLAHNVVIMVQSMVSGNPSPLSSLKGLQRAPFERSLTK